MKLHEQVAELKNLLDSNADIIQELKSYLNSNKFDSDSSVNKNDIFLRLQNYNFNI